MPQGPLKRAASSEKFNYPPSMIYYILITLLAAQPTIPAAITYVSTVTPTPLATPTIEIPSYPSDYPSKQEQGTVFTRHTARQTSRAPSPTPIAFVGSMANPILALLSWAKYNPSSIQPFPTKTLSLSKPPSSSTLLPSSSIRKSSPTPYDWCIIAAKHRRQCIIEGKPL